MLINRLSSEHLRLHKRAIELTAQHRRLEAEVVSALAAIDREKIYMLLGCSSLFIYAVSLLGLSEAQAYAFIAVSRKCQECEPLRQAIEGRELSVCKAARVLSALTADDAEALLRFAKTHTTREIDHEVARRRPKNRRTRDKIKPLTQELSKLECDISHTVSVKLRRAQSVLSSKLGRAVDFNGTLERALDEYLAKHDPVARAERAHTLPRKANPKRASELCTSRVKRQPLSAAQKHQVARRDQGRCTFINPATGQRCMNDRWLHAHHIVSVSEGGGNSPENLRTLCASHHDLVHQLRLPLGPDRTSPEWL